MRWMTKVRAPVAAKAAAVERRALGLAVKAAARALAKKMSHQSTARSAAAAVVEKAVRQHATPAHEAATVTFLCAQFDTACAMELPRAARRLVTFSCVAKKK